MAEQHSLLQFADGATQRISFAGKAINRGADGAIHRSSCGHYALKLYHAPGKNPQRRDKIWQMLLHSPQDSGAMHFAWPQALLLDKRGGFLGYAMPLLDVASHVSLDMVLSQRGRTAEKLPQHNHWRLQVAISLCQRVADLHRLGHSIIDLKPANLLVHRQSGEVSVVDCDGFAVQGDDQLFPAHQFTAGFIAPEAWQRKQTPESLGRAQDEFALSIILFQLLNEGLHPYQGVPGKGQQLPPDQQQRIGAGLYAYGLRSNPAIKPSPWSTHRDFPQSLRQAFDQHLQPGSRLTVERWLQLLQGLAPQLKTCRSNREHQYWGKHCPSCARQQVKVKVRQPVPVTPTRPAPARPHQQPAARQPLPQAWAQTRAWAQSQARAASQPTQPPAPPRPQLQPQSSNHSSMLINALQLIVVAVFATTLWRSMATDTHRPPSTAPTETVAAQSGRQAEPAPQQHLLPGGVSRIGSASSSVHFMKAGAQDDAPGYIPLQPLTVPNPGRLDDDGRLQLMSLFPADPQGGYRGDGPIRLATPTPGQREISSMHREFQPPRIHSLHDVRTLTYRQQPALLLQPCKESDCKLMLLPSSGQQRTFSPPPGSDWQFAIDPDASYVALSSSRELRLYRIDDASAPLARTQLPRDFHDFNLDAITLSQDAGSLMLGLSRTDRSQHSYQTILLEFQRVAGGLRLRHTLRQLRDEKLGFHPGSWHAIDVRASTLALAGYRDVTYTRQNNFEAYGRPLISLWRRSASGDWQLSRILEGPQGDNTPKVSLIRPLSVDDSSDWNSHQANGFQLSADGSYLLSGVTLDNKKAQASAWVSDTTAPDIHYQRLAMAAPLQRLSPLLSRAMARLSPDGSKAAISWFVHEQSGTPQQQDWTQYLQIDTFELRGQP